MSLRVKVLLPLLLFSIGLIAYLYTYWMPRSLSNIEEGVRQSIERHLDSVDEALIPLLMGHQLDAVYENLDSLMKKNQNWMDIRLLDSSGRMLYPLALPPSTESKRLEKDIHTIERRIKYRDMDLGSLVLKVDFAPILSAMRERHWELMSIMLGGILIFVITTGFVLDRLVVRPVTLLSHASRKLAQDDFNVPLLKGGKDEVGVLVDDFNSMSIAIRDYRSHLQNAHEQLQLELSERKKTEGELKRLTQRNEMILNSAGEGIYGTDIKGNILFINQAAQKSLGVAMPDVLGKSSHQLFHHTKSDGSPYPAEECPLYKSLARGESYHGVDEVFWRSNGEMFPIEHVNTPLLDHGVVAGAVVVFRDITARKQAEDEIRRLSESLERRVEERTADLQKKSDELRDSQSALLNIVEDLNERTTELAMANAKLKELDRLKSMFIASMSHELRTPLNSVIGFSSILINEWAGPVSTEQKENLASILRSGRHLLSLINDVIDVSKIEAGMIESMTEDFDIHDVVSEAITSFMNEIKEKGLELTVETAHQVIHADRRRLLQCLLNIISNAVKFTERGVVAVSVQLSADGGSINISVSDTGIGIREEDMQKLFSAFARLDSPLRSRVLGTGLGLYLTKKLVREVLKGDILVTSTHGKGSCFTLIVPVTGSKEA